jgi:hypothetical protein
MSNLQRSRLIVGLLLLGVVVLLLTFKAENVARAGIVALGVLGLIAVAISRRN